MRQLNDIERSILKKLAKGECWARAIPPIYKRFLQDLVDAGLVERFAPAGQRGKNRIRLTGAGYSAL